MKNNVIILLVFASIILASCTGGGNQPTNSPFIGGSDGLSMEFALGAPPDEIYDNALNIPIHSIEFLPNPRRTVIPARQTMQKCTGLPQTVSLPLPCNRGTGRKFLAPCTLRLCDGWMGRARYGSDDVGFLCEGFS
jgi:hypothetical protein